MNLMGCRLINLGYATTGYLKTNVFLIGQNGDAQFPLFAYIDPQYPTEGIDDIGIYVAIPFLIKIFNCSLTNAVALFFYGLATISLLLGSLGIFLLYKKFLQRIVGIFCLSCLIFFACTIGDVYTMYIFAVVSVVPLCMYALKTEYTKSAMLIFFASGLLLTFFHYCRAYAGLSVFVFILCSLFIARYSMKKKIILLGSLLAGIMVVQLSIKQIIYSRDNYVKQNFKQNIEVPRSHPFWHTIYLGFSFLHYGNEDHIEWNDSFGLMQARKINPTVEYHDPEYEIILRNKVLHLILNKTIFVINTLIAKFFVLLWYLLLYGNIGLIIGLFTSSWYTCLPYFTGLLVSSTTPLLSLPNTFYSLEFIALGYMFSLVSINDFIKGGITRKKSYILIFFILMSSYMFCFSSILKKIYFVFVSKHLLIMSSGVLFIILILAIQLFKNKRRTIIS